MEPVRVGIIGCGVIGRHHVQTAVGAEEVELVAVADRIPERAEAIAAEYGVKEVFVEGDDLIDRAAVEAVVLAFPAEGRCELGLHAFAAGKHLLTEKPVARNVGEVRRLLAARGDRVAACCSSRFRYSDSARFLTDWLAKGELGELRAVRCRAIVGAGKPRSEPAPEWRLKRHRNGGGILMNWGCYDLDYLLGLLGWSLRPRTVFAQTWSVAEPFSAPGYVAEGSDAETHFAALIRCDGGSVISFERAELAAAQTSNTWEIAGSLGTLHLHMLQGRKTITVDRAVANEGVITETLWEGADEGVGVHAGPLTDLARAIREGRDPLTTLEQALVVQQISDAIYASAEQGKSVDIE